MAVWDQYGSQEVLSAARILEHGDNFPLEDSLAIPVYASTLSFLALSIHWVWRTFSSNKETERQLWRQGVVSSAGGPVIYSFQLLRLLGCLGLLGLKVWAILQDGPHERAGILSYGLCGVYAYSAVLSLFSVATSSSWTRVAIRHLCMTLFVTWSVITYRDVYPLATFDLEPIDANDGSALWISVGILTLIAIVVPLCIPRVYVPVDPKNPSKDVHLEQTVSILSRLTYTYLDPLIYRANQVDHLSFDELPPIPDYDEAKNMVTKNMAILEKYVAKKRHISYGFLDVFKYEFIGLVFTSTISVVSSFATPVGVNGLLKYLETGGEGATIRPWFWIFCLFIGPCIIAIISQVHGTFMNLLWLRSGATINQLVLDHALRLRVKSEVAREAVSENATAVATPDTASASSQSGPSTESPQESPNDSSDGKKKQSSTNSTPDASIKPPKGSQSKGNFLGKVNNLVTSDANTIATGCDVFMLVLYVPIQLAFCIYFLYSILGWSAFVGLAATIVCFPLPGYMGKLMAHTQKMKMEKTDERVQSVTETMAIIRMIKLFGWERKMAERISKKRQEELFYLRRQNILGLLIGMTGFTIPFITTISTYATYSLVMKKDLTASVVFSSMVVFDMFRMQIWSVQSKIPGLIRVKVALDRINSFLYETELLDKFTSGSHVSYNEDAVASHSIGFKNASFTWDSESDGSVTPGSNSRVFTLRIDGEVSFKRGHINLIIGPTGSGKTSILMALLGEMHYIPHGPDSYYNLPRTEGVAYAAQESWVQNETIRDNILFGSEYDETRYNKVIDQCGLRRDLELFEAGDLTEVGEKGLTLSGGQKARVTLARAVYSKAGILLLDDVLAALDVHTAKWVVDKCFKGDLIRGRTVILVTHNIALARPIAEFVLSMGSNGRVSTQGSLSAVLAQDAELVAELESEEKELEKAEQTVDDQVLSDKTKQLKDGKLVLAEELNVGRLKWEDVKLFVAGLGGQLWYIWWAVFIADMICSPVLETLQVWYLGYWSTQYEGRPSSEVSAPYYLTVYSLLVVLSVLISTGGHTYYYTGTIRASGKIHEKLITSILGSTMRWLDVTPTSRVMSRCTRDVSVVDEVIPMLFAQVVEVSMLMISQLAAVMFVAPVALVPGIATALVTGFVGRAYLKASLAIKREMSNTQAPILGHFDAAIVGLVSIRAYGAQDAYKAEFLTRLDRYTRTSRTSRDIVRWMGVRTALIGAIFVTAIAAYLTYGKGVSASNTGFAMHMSVSFCQFIRVWIFGMNGFEVQANSLERIRQYLGIEHEPSPTPAGVPPAYWPSSGNLSVQTLSARYSADGPKVLDNLNFNIASGERVGIVGRTGSGKSSLTLALLRCIITEGRVYFDGLPTDTINLDALRSKITIIPQVPELMSGTLRQNLDPFEEYDDVVLNDCLRAAGLFSLQTHEDEARLTLDSQIASGGSNLSVGQRQILALARAMVRKSKVLILDEATSAIDNETDNVIQASLRNELDKDVTLLTIAHRLQTIMDSDKIIVLDAGHIAEFGTPKELLDNESSLLRALVDESGDKEKLHIMANRAR
ncbi:hypothetical protein BXZ70DRAFT_964229 [Cristinia sonorae]|uniref:P-loop containing nucleoside triphosphate hydrolase protein n=1 Tax=Cristinia sonorae TaxID=1940300 RepID=A0A8K0XJE4_9AGAR|nr:hypothetical protein BXZ70DRAFT_964229 [Cristinia sonorae]